MKPSRQSATDNTISVRGMRMVLSPAVRHGDAEQERSRGNEHATRKNNAHKSSREHDVAGLDLLGRIFDQAGRCEIQPTKELARWKFAAQAPASSCRSWKSLSPITHAPAARPLLVVRLLVESPHPGSQGLPDARAARRLRVGRDVMMLLLPKP